ncbi:hypothetical protein AVDCRST_MAG92-1580 [uncultured Coleofasciculus sp.]|uniref:Uncharacterized protein n=1 Tax=uncultured Coleofasciculus sp. TaxID=1267456 RepID=A0A6J4I4V4_9CYAN|nr:hypothetical protein AVDCRST_MAG92-1580 [uncultured Coleofasciculus sp.]
MRSWELAQQLVLMKTQQKSLRLNPVIINAHQYDYILKRLYLMPMMFYLQHRWHMRQRII